MAGYVCFDPGAPLAAAMPREVSCPAEAEAVTAEFRELCALTAGGARRLAGVTLRCRTLLVPEGSYQPLWQAEQVVSYGLAGRSTLTLSSMNARSVLCVQRRLRDRFGRAVEEQELPLDAVWSALPAADRLLLAGVRLLLGGQSPGAGE